MDSQLAAALAWIEPHALLLALLLPPLIRLVGHWIPEEVFMVAVGVLAARSDSPLAAVSILVAVTASHFASDQLVYLAGRWLRPRLERYPRLGARLGNVAGRLSASPHAILGLVPARVLPLGRGAWLAGCGVVGIPWPRFAIVDLLALAAHLATWSGLGWWMAGDLDRLGVSAELAKALGVWVVVCCLAAVSAVAVWRRWVERQPRVVDVLRRVARR